jgi:hypothetical protein
MLDELFVRQIRRTTRNGLILAVVFLGFTLTPAWHYRAYLFSIVRGPAPVSEAQLNSPSDPNPLLESFVKVHGSEIATTGARKVAHDTGTTSSSQNPKSVLGDVVALKVGDCFLLSLVPADSKALDLSGRLVEMPPDVRRIVITNRLAQHPELDQLVYPYFLDTTKSRFDEPWPLLLGTFFFLLGVFCLVQGVRHAAAPESHPVMKALRRYGDPGNVSVQIAQELRAEGDREKFGAARITSHWLVEMSQFKTAVIQLSDILWAYQKVVTHRVNFIPTGKTYFVVVRDRSGQSVEISVKKDQPAVVLQSLSRRNPWALYGFDQQVANVWSKNRAQLIELVEKRKAALNSESKQPAAAQPVPVLAGKV